MLSRFRQVSHFRSIDPASVILVGLAAILAAIFIFATQYTDLAVQALPVLAAAAIVGLLFVPQKNVTNALMVAAAISIPFAHFALYVVAGEGIQWIHLFGALLIIHFVARLLLGHRMAVAPALPWVLGLLLATFVSLFAVINLPDVHIVEFWKSEVQLIFCIVFFIAVTQANLTNRQMILLLKALIVLSVLVALFALYQQPARFYGLPGGVLTLTNPSLSGQIQVTRIIFYMVRSSAIFSEPSYLGHYMVGMMALSLAAVLHRPNLFGAPWVLWLILAIQAVGLVVSSSMSGFYILGLLILVMLLFEKQRERKKIFITILGIVGIAAIVMLTIELISGFPISQYLFARVHGIFMYLTSGGDKSYLIATESAHQRVDTAGIALAVWRDYPIVGVGVGTYSLISHQYGDYNPMGFAANTLVSTLAEMGLVGFIALFGMATSSLLGLWNIFRRPGRFLNNESRDTETELFPIIARMLFYLVIVEILYFQMLSNLYWPGVWFYFGLAGLVAIGAGRFKISQSGRN